MPNLPTAADGRAVVEPKGHGADRTNEAQVAYRVSMNAGEWTFLSNHGHVLVCLARDPDARMRDVATAVGVTERAVQQIVRDLVGLNYVEKEKIGRRNRYRVVRSAHFRHELEAEVSLGEFLDLVLGRRSRGR
jgi:DNA-binding MarR family transcriptional regulator